MVLPSRNKRGFILFVNVCRWLLALALILSGFLKAVDPVAGVYKLQEYVSAFGLSGIPGSWLPFFAVVQAAAEFLVGFWLFVGIYRRVVPFVALLAILLFTPFTLYIWMSGVVSDCGCFGETVVMSNSMTFFKNVLLLVLAVVAFAWRRLFVRRLSSNTRWVAVLCSVVYIIALQSFCLNHLPLIDAGPYAVGGNLRSMVEYTPAEYEYMAVYQKDGNEALFPAGTDSVAGWEFVRYAEQLVTPGTEPEIENFSIIDWEYDIEMADGLLADTGYVCVVVIEDAGTASLTHVDRINDLYDYCTSAGIRFCAVSSAGEDEVALWTKRTGAEYPLYWADAAMLRSMVHANPGLVLLKDGVIVGKCAAADIPAVQEGEELSALMPVAALSSFTDYRSLTFWLIILPAVLFVLSLLDVLLVQVARRRGSDEPVAVPAEENIVENK